MGNSQQQIVVYSKREFDTTIQSYMSRGFAPQQTTADLCILTMQTKGMKLGCLFIFFVLVFFPVAILMWMSNKKNEGIHTVIIRLDTDGPDVAKPLSPDEVMPSTLQMSPDKQQWWNGTGWISVDVATPPMAQRSPDGQLWWDGESWRAVR